MLVALSLLALTAPAEAGQYDALFDAVAAEYQVPAPLLEALAYEASRFDPDAATEWGGLRLLRPPRGR